MAYLDCFSHIYTYTQPVHSLPRVLFSHFYIYSLYIAYLECYSHIYTYSLYIAYKRVIVNFPLYLYSTILTFIHIHTGADQGFLMRGFKWPKGGLFWYFYLNLHKNLHEIEIILSKSEVRANPLNPLWIRH